MIPASVTVKPYRFTEELLKEYHAAESAAFDGAAWTVNNLRWMQGAEEMVNFGAFAGEELIGNTSTWKITGARSAAENVFVKPEWQKQGIARAVIAAALKHLKEQGKEIATLGTSGTNQKAIRLYLQIGYELAGTRQTVTYEI